MDATPRGNRVHIAFFGLRNAGKSTLVNSFCGQEVAIVSDTPGTTTDPVSKAIEILPLGPCLVTDTAGLDDAGELGAQRVKRTLEVLATTDIAVWVWGGGRSGKGEARPGEYRDFREACAKARVTVLEFRRGDDIEELKRKIAEMRLDEKVPGLLDGLVRSGEHVALVCPIDSSAPKGRLILPQVQVLRECLDLHVRVTVAQPGELAKVLAETDDLALVITDSQAFAEVSAVLRASPRPDLPLTSFSILFARQKGDLAEFAAGLEAVRHLPEGATVLISEACTHRRQCQDIGETKIPKAVMALSGCTHLNFAFSSGATFNPETMRCLAKHAALIVHCGGCMLTRRELLHRIAQARAAKVPIVNYGLVLSAAAGLAGVEASGVVRK